MKATRVVWRCCSGIDADPNRPVSRWAKRPGRPEGLAVIDDVVEETIIDRIARHGPMMVGYAVSRADLVIIPTQGSQLDAAEAVKALKLVRNMEKARDGRAIRCPVHAHQRRHQAADPGFDRGGIS